MLQSLISLSDEDIALATDAVSRWCVSQRVAIESADGRRAPAAAVEPVHSRATREDLTASLFRALGPLTERLDTIRHVSLSDDHPARTSNPAAESGRN